MNEVKSSRSGSTSDGRYRNFATVVYPESAPSDWRTTIAEAKIPVFIGPLHDKDVNPGGEQKKPHFHVLVAYEGKKSINQVSAFFSTFGGVGCEVVQSLRGYARYLCHLDNPEKAQYDTEDVISYGIDYQSTIGLPTDRYKIIAEMQDFVDDNCIYSFAQLNRYARQNRYDWYRILCDSAAIIMKEYIKSAHWESYTCAAPSLSPNAEE